MKTKLTSLTLGLLLGWASVAHSQNYSPDELTCRTIHRRAVEAVIWGIRG